MKQNGKLNEEEKAVLAEVERRASLLNEDASFFLQIRNLIVGAANQASDNWDMLRELEES